MKNKIISLATFAILLTLTSCKKDWVCGCRGTSNEPGTTPTTVYVTFTNAKKSDAKKACVNTTSEYQSGGQTYKNTTSCTLS